MKTIFKTIILFACIFIVACENKKTLANHFTSSDDTLVIRTKKVKGSGLFQMGAGYPIFKDTTEKFPYSITYPKNIQDIQRYVFIPDFQEKAKFYIDILKGTKNGQLVYVVDENDNKDLQDDTIRSLEKMQWYSAENAVKCKYSISNGEKIVKDSSWLQIGTVGDDVLLGTSDHLIGEFSIDNEIYKIGITDRPGASQFKYSEASEIALLSNKGDEKDSISIRDLFKIGEFLNLDNSYYTFSSISNNGEYISIVKEKGFENETGTQVGMISPSFNVVTTAADTISSSNLQTKITVIANSCGCGGDKESTQASNDIKKAFDNINVLHVDSKIETESNDLHIDMENSFNKDFYNNYRQEYCSRICYVIGKNKRIIDKFYITDWKTILPNLIEK